MTLNNISPFKNRKCYERRLISCLLRLAKRPSALQAQTQVEQETTLNQITTLLQSSSAPDFEAALKITMTLVE